MPGIASPIVIDGKRQVADRPQPAAGIERPEIVNDETGYSTCKVSLVAISGRHCQIQQVEEIR